MENPCVWSIGNADWTDMVTNTAHATESRLAAAEAEAGAGIILSCAVIAKTLRDDRGMPQQISNGHYQGVIIGP
jgi:hypothetical protein